MTLLRTTSSACERGVLRRISRGVELEGAVLDPQQVPQEPCPFENNYFTKLCSGSEAGSYLRLIDFVFKAHRLCI